MRYEPVLELRGLLEQLGHTAGLTQEEKGQSHTHTLTHSHTHTRPRRISQSAIQTCTLSHSLHINTVSGPHYILGIL